MENQITQEMQEVLNKHLPAQMGEVLKKRLAQADADAQLVKDQDIQIKRLEREFNVQREKVEEYKKFDERNSELDKRERDIEKKEADHKVLEAELKATESEKRASELFGLVQMVFKSPIYRKVIQNDLYAGYDSQNRYNTTGGTPREVKETIE